MDGGDEVAPAEPQAEPVPALQGELVQQQHEHRCGKCDAQFCSRNELFAHLDAADHFVDGIASSTTSSGAKQGNAALREYYARQLRETVSRQGDPSLWERNYALLSVPLPHTFRGSASSCLLPHVIQKLQAQHSTELLPLAFDAPDVVAWRLAARDIETAKLIAAGQDLGILHRQEVCSMLPPLVLDVRPEHTVLDLCAAPGSKTLQLLESMNLQANSATEDAVPGGVRGLLVANDVSRERAMTIAQRSRRGSSRTALALLSTDARRFPALYRRAYRIKYDRVLCDVPCSGDGTLRKSAGMWSRWSVKDGLSIHLLQLAILKRGLELLADGGRLVYSTCSLNPIEGEAVVAAAIRHFEGAVQLCDIDRERWLRVVENGCEGLTCWGVPSPDYVGANEAGRSDDTDIAAASTAASAMWTRYDDVPAEFRRNGSSSPAERSAPATSADEQRPVKKDKGKKKRKGVLLCPTMFPPIGQPGMPPHDCVTSSAQSILDDCADPGRAAQEAAEELRKCVRVLPTQGDGGGFFIALLGRNRRPRSQQCEKETDLSKAQETKQLGSVPDTAHSPDRLVVPQSVEATMKEPFSLGDGSNTDWGEAGRTSRAFLFDTVAPELAASFNEWWGVPPHMAPNEALRIDRISGRLLLPSPELSMLKVSKRHLRQRLVVEAGLCLCAQAHIAAPGVSVLEPPATDASASENPMLAMSGEEEMANRWNLFDEAAEYVAGIATRRVLQCTAAGFAHLLQHGRLDRESLASGDFVEQESFLTCFAQPGHSPNPAGTTQLETGGVVLRFDFRREDGHANKDSPGGKHTRGVDERIAAVSGRLQTDGVVCLANDRTKHALLRTMGAAMDDS